MIEYGLFEYLLAYLVWILVGYGNLFGSIVIQIEQNRMNLVAWQGEYLEDVCRFQFRGNFPTWSVRAEPVNFFPEVSHSHSPKRNLRKLANSRKQKDVQKIIFFDTTLGGVVLTVVELEVHVFYFKFLLFLCLFDVQLFEAPGSTMAAVSMVAAGLLLRAKRSKMGCRSETLHGIKFPYALQKDAYADLEFLNDVGVLILFFLVGWLVWVTEGLR